MNKIDLINNYPNILDLFDPVIIDKIHSEFFNKNNKFYRIEWVEQKLYSGVWSICPLYALQIPISGTDLLFPTTFDTVKKIPGLVNASFSIMGPDTFIAPHEGYNNQLIRFHLGLTNNDGDVGLKVDGTTFRWHYGKMFAFDDTITHSAWNHSNNSRVVLIVDFLKNPEVDFVSTPGDLKLFTETIVEIQKKHEKRIGPTGPVGLPGANFEPDGKENLNFKIKKRREESFNWLRGS